MPEKIPKTVHHLCNLMTQHNPSGCLKVTDSRHKFISWELYYQDNYIYYITTNVGQKERLSCLCKYLIPKFSPPTLLFNIGDYESMTSWWESKNLPLSQLKRLLFQLTEEGLSHILTIENPLIEFSSNQQILSPITKFSREDILNTAYVKSTVWKNVSSHYLSPFHRLYLDSSKTYHFYQFWKSQKNLDQTQVPRISFWLLNLAQKKSIYQLSQERGILPLTFIEDFQYLLQSNIIDILPFVDNVTEVNSQNTITSERKERKLSSISSPIIACIDDSRAVQKHIQKTLEIIGYQTLSLTDPTLCLTTLARYEPKVILMDINMPQINGYELCRILQKSSKLRNIPIVMLTGRDGLVDKFRAKMLGVEHYLTKPCQPQELLKIIKQLTLNQTANSLEDSQVISTPFNH